MLDVGCGEGMLWPALQRAGCGRYLGIDISETAIERARRRWGPPAEFRAVHGDAFHPEERFDAVVFNETLYYFDDPAAALARYEPSLAPGGKFVVSMVCLGPRDTLMKQKIWFDLEKRYRVHGEAVLYVRDSTTWVVRVLAPPAPA